MIKPAYYNEIDKYAAQWLRNLITLGVIAPGDVDERSIEDVHPDELRQYRQCHFFAGIGVWSYALRRAGWADDRPIWTGSAPCQPFSEAGKGTAFDDQRHLWPHFHWLIQECRPHRVVGEQVARGHAGSWLNLVQTDMEGIGYAFGAVAFPSASVGAPHARERTYWMADAISKQSERGIIVASDEIGRTRPGRGIARRGDALVLADAGKFDHRREAEPADYAKPQANGSADKPSRRGRALGGLADASGTRLEVRQRQRGGQESARRGRNGADGSGQLIGMAHAYGGDTGAEWEQRGGKQRQQPKDCGTRVVADAIVQQRSNGQPGFSHEHDESGRIEDTTAVAGLRSDLRPGPVNGFWRNADWILCRDAKWRPIEPGTFPLVDGTASRVGSRRADWHTAAGPEGFGHRANRLKGYGNAINAEAAIVFIKATM